jgi:hypothetical protein
MKKFGIVLPLFALALAISGCGEGETVTKKLSVYPFNTAVVRYELSGAVSGEETLYIKGDMSVDQKFVTQGGADENTLELNLGPEIYIADLLKMTAVKVINSDYDKLIKLSPEDQKKEFIRAALGIKDSAELPVSSGTKQIAGQSCDVYIIDNVGTACLWNGIILEKEIPLLGITNTKTAISVETNVDIPKDQFDLPAGVIVKN